MKQLPQLRILSGSFMLSNGLQQGGIRVSFVINQVPQHYEHNLIQIFGLCPAQGFAFSSCAARRNNIASSPKGAENIAPTGNPSGVQCSGADIEGCPVRLYNAVNGLNSVISFMNVRMSFGDRLNRPSGTGGLPSVGFNTTS